MKNSNTHNLSSAIFINFKIRRSHLYDIKLNIKLFMPKTMKFEKNLTNINIFFEKHYMRNTEKIFSVENDLENIKYANKCFLKLLTLD